MPNDDSIADDLISGSFFKQRLAAVQRLWDERDYDAALAEVDSLLKAWPGNARLHILRASLLQLQDFPQHGLDTAKAELQFALELDRGSPAAAIELGNFLDAVEDDPDGAAKAFQEGVTSARRLLLEALIGQAKAYRQRGKEFARCLQEILLLHQFEAPKKGSRDETTGDVVLVTLAGDVHAIQLKGPYAESLQELLSELAASRVDVRRAVLIEKAANAPLAHPPSSVSAPVLIPKRSVSIPNRCSMRT